ncbi:alpha/beta hydrolase fold domain-containing protein [Rhodococcus qingshengii]|uniref:alpha/beta hydrolase fold domain-containing protein n=1 Tax=Rhodococcus qingshengii TaxID=334542 RepID=UPI001455F071|nr:alpha/beta hydrolase fold domain-containing protein [Rhodococcus qingshengii]
MAAPATGSVAALCRRPARSKRRWALDCVSVARGSGAGPHVRIRVHRRVRTGYGLTQDALRQIRSYYLPDPSVESDSFTCHRWKAASLAGVPPAHISAENDPVCEEGARYARRLVEEGVDASFSLQAGHIHIPSAFTKLMESARARLSNSNTAIVIGVDRTVTLLGDLVAGVELTDRSLRADLVVTCAGDVSRRAAWRVPASLTNEVLLLTNAAPQ